MKKWLKIFCSLVVSMQVLQWNLPVYADEEEIIEYVSEETEIEEDSEQVEQITEEVVDETDEETEDEIVDEAEPVEEEIVQEEAANATSYVSAADDTGNTANLVLYVEFSNTTHNHSNNGYFDSCFEQCPNIEKYFSGDFETYPCSMKAYLNSISYGALNVAQIIPQYDSATNTIVPITLPNTAQYYLGYGNDQTNDGSIIQDALSVLNTNKSLPSSINIDRDGNGVIDNITIVVPEEYNGSSSTSITSHASYAQVASINGKKSGSYTIVSESHLYNGLTESGLIIHEYLHTRGLKDLYCNTSGLPVDLWDIMASDSVYLQYPLAYFRSQLGWIQLDTVTSNTTYTLTAASKANKNDKQAVIVKTPYSDSEFFVIEYRKKGNYTYGTGTEKYDAKIPGSGIIVYRINTALESYDCKGGAPWSTYVFRENDTYDSGGESAQGDIRTASYLSLESNHTSYGTSNLDDGLEQGAITYSDNVNSGIVIKNVGSASGDAITFEIEFTDMKDRNVWETDLVDNTNVSSYLSVSCKDETGTQYILKQTDFYNSSTYLYIYNNGSLQYLAKGPIGNSFNVLSYKNNLYVSYINTSSKACVDQWDGSSWQNVFQSSETVNELSTSASSIGIGIAYVVGDSEGNTTIYAYKYTSKSTKLGTKVSADASKWPSNPTIVCSDTDIYIEYREAKDNSIKIKKYVSSSNAWSNISTSIVGSARIFKNGDTIYLVSIEQGKGKYVYQYNGTLSKVNTSPFTSDASESAFDICTDGDSVYIVYYDDTAKMAVCKSIVNGEWVQIGNPITTQTIQSIQCDYVNGKIQVLYTDSSTNKTVIKYIKVKKDTYSIVYNSNNGSGKVVDSNTYPSGSQVKALQNSFIYDGYRFIEWNTQPDGTGIRYLPNDEIEINENVTLYAIWKERDEKLAGYSMSLSNKIEVNFFMELNDVILEDPNATMEFRTPTGEINEVLISSITPEQKEENEYYRFTCALSAKDMTGTVQAVLKYGLEQSEIYEFSVENYVSSINEQDVDQEIKNLANAMLKYGYYAQKYFDYKVELLPSNIESTKSCDLSSYTIVQEKDEQVEYIGARLVLGSSLDLKLYFMTDQTLHVEDGYDYEMSQEGKYTVVTFRNVDVFDTYVIKGESEYCIKYPLLAYGNKAYKSGNTSLIQLIEALYEYGTCLEAIKD